MTLVFHMSEFVGEWVKQRISHLSLAPGMYVAIGIADGDRLLAGVVYHDFNGNGISMSVAADSPRWCTRSVLAAIHRYPFEQLQVRRVTVTAERKNKRSRKLIEGVGYKLEGVLREGFGKSSDAMLYGMLKRECKWLERKDNGQQRLIGAGGS